MQDVTDILITLMANQTRPPPQRPPDGDNQEHHLQFAQGRSDRRLHAHNEKTEKEISWNQGENADYEQQREER